MRDSGQITDRTTLLNVEKKLKCVQVRSRKIRLLPQCRKDMIRAETVEVERNG